MKINYCLLLGVLLSTNLSIGQDTTYHKRMYLGTGEYSPSQNWHALLRFDESETYNSDPGPISYTPEGTIPIQQCFDSGVMLNFGHGFYLEEALNRVYLATLFTNANNILTTNSDTAVGSIAIFDNAHMLDGPQIPTRHIFGPNTQLKQPHSCWLDESRDLLYVPNTFGQNILVYDNASSADGNVSPVRVIDSDSLGYPVYIYVDSLVDRMFVCSMPGPSPTEPKAQILIYNDASTLTGLSDPDIRIIGDNTRLALINQTVHNCQWNPNSQLLAVGHHTNELLFFDLSGINWNPPSTDILDLTPRVVRVDDPGLGFDSTDVNLYGVYWDIETDTIYCSVGVDNPGGGPMVGAPPNAVKIYGDISNPSLSGITPPDRQIYWANADTYHPPQPIWVQDYMKITNGLDENLQGQNIIVYPNPSSSGFVSIKSSEIINQIKLIDVYGHSVNARFDYSEETVQLRIEELSTGLYFLHIQTEQNHLIIKKVIKI